MGKKSRHTKAKRRPGAARAVRERHSQQARPTPAALPPPTRVSPKAQDFTSRHQYVMPEIKRIGIIAGAIILTLIILSFVLG